MKRIICFIVAVILLFVLSGCNDHYDCHIVHVTDSNGNCTDIKIDVYYTESGGIKCYWNNYNESAFFPSGTYVLFKDKCPLCNSN